MGNRRISAAVIAVLFVGAAAPARADAAQQTLTIPSAANQLGAATTDDLSATTLTLAGPRAAARAKALTITGTLASPLGLPDGAEVSISRTDLDYPAGLALGATTVAADGTFTLTDIPTAGGLVTYHASFAGDATRAPADAAFSLTVSRLEGPVSINNSGKTYAYGQTATFTASLGTTYKNRVVEIWADPDGADQAPRLVKRGTVNSAGKFSASLRMTRNTAMSAFFAGDARYGPNTEHIRVYTKVSLTLRTTGYYKTAKIGSTKYRYFHASRNANFPTAMTNGANRKVYLELQRYSKGKWKSWKAGYFNAADVFHLSGSGLKGSRLRIRAAYVRYESGDSLNVNTWTSYQYFTFTK